MKLEVKNIQGQKVGEIDLSDEVFGVEVKEHLLWEVVKAQRAKARAGTHSTLRESEVRGGGKKPFKQKGTGNARQGSSRAPHFVGGGSVFGPKPRDYEYAVPKKVRQSALRSALSLKAKEGKLIILDSFTLAEAKTKRAVAALKALGIHSALLVDAGDNESLSRSVRNLPKAKFIATEGLNVYDVLGHDALVITQQSVAQVEARLASPPSRGGSDAQA